MVFSLLDIGMKIIADYKMTLLLILYQFEGQIGPSEFVSTTNIKNPVSFFEDLVLMMNFKQSNCTGVFILFHVLSFL